MALEQSKTVNQHARNILEWFTRARERLQLFPYRCPSGKLTIGYGHNLDAKGIPPSVADLLFQYDLNDADRDARAALPFLDTLDPVRQAAFTDMAFNMGRAALKTFKVAIAAAERGDWPACATAIELSKYYRQTGDRAKAIVEMIRTGKEPE